MKYCTRRDLMIVAAKLRCYITQDRDGFVQLWERRPIRNAKLGKWESGSDPILLRDMPLIASYTNRWAYSLITPHTLQMYKEGGCFKED